ncbi:MAG: hypothetical protein ABSB71_13400 [Candidatus Bathyarchaeia archaeon]|jgi:hypothetical protein
MLKRKARIKKFIVEALRLHHSLSSMALANLLKKEPFSEDVGVHIVSSVLCEMKKEGLVTYHKRIIPEGWVRLWELTAAF